MASPRILGRMMSNDAQRKGKTLIRRSKGDIKLLFSCDVFPESAKNYKKLMKLNGLDIIWMFPCSREYFLKY